MHLYAEKHVPRRRTNRSIRLCHLSDKPPIGSLSEARRIHSARIETVFGLANEPSLAPSHTAGGYSIQPTKL